MRGGRPVIVLEHVTRLQDDLGAGWPQPAGHGCYRVQITGEPNYTLDLQLMGTDGDHNTAGLKATAMRLVNAVPAVVDARPGLVTALDLPPITAGVSSSHDRAHRTGWPWPPELDALTAAPAFHDLLFENKQVRVLEAHVGPGQTVPVHTHCWPGVLYILSVSDFVRPTPTATSCSTRGARTMHRLARASGARRSHPILSRTSGTADYATSPWSSSNRASRRSRWSAAPGRSTCSWRHRPAHRRCPRNPWPPPEPRWTRT